MSELFFGEMSSCGVAEAVRWVFFRQQINWTDALAHFTKKMERSIIIGFLKSTEIHASLKKGAPTVGAPSRVYGCSSLARDEHVLLPVYLSIVAVAIPRRKSACYITASRM
jgi:hypothetical protein